MRTPTTGAVCGDRRGVIGRRRRRVIVGDADRHTDTDIDPRIGGLAAVVMATMVKADTAIAIPTLLDKALCRQRPRRR
jgi:hypothetical protein